MAIRTIMLMVSCCLVTSCGTPRTKIDFDRVLSWLPADTETLQVATGPFWMSNFRVGSDQTHSHRVTTQELEKHFQSLALSLLVYVRKGDLEKRVEGKKVVFAIEASRHFRPPKGFGETLYEGCEIAIFAGDLSDPRDRFMAEANRAGLQIEQIEGQVVVAFQEVLEQDAWTMYVAFPQNNVVAVATNRDFLRELLARMRGSGGKRALPDTLPEWNYVNRKAEFWGLRHFDRDNFKEDPTSPFGGTKSANLPDEQAIGFTYQCDPLRESKASLIYLTGQKDAIERVERNRFSVSSEPDQTAALHIRYHELRPGVIRSTYDLDELEPLNWFFFVFMGNLGHAVFV